MLDGSDLAVTHGAPRVLAGGDPPCHPARVTEVIELTHETLQPLYRRAAIAVRGQPARRRARSVRNRRCRPHRSGDRGGARLRHRCHRAAPGRYVFIRLPSQTVRRDRVHVPRPGPHPDEAAAFESGVNVTIGLPIVRTSGITHRVRHRLEGNRFNGSLDHAAWASRLAGEISEDRRGRGTAMLALGDTINSRPHVCQTAGADVRAACRMALADRALDRPARSAVVQPARETNPATSCRACVM